MQIRLCLVVARMHPGRGCVLPAPYPLPRDCFAQLPHLATLAPPTIHGACSPLRPSSCIETPSRPSIPGACMSFLSRFYFRPRLLDTLKGYNRKDFLHDLGAGVTVGVVALPLAMAFAIASGLKPEQGIFTAIVAGLVIAALGGSNVQIGGPAGAFIVIVVGIVERYGLTNLLIATALAGALLFAMGALKLGALVRYIPVTIII